MLTILLFLLAFISTAPEVEPEHIHSHYYEDSERG